MKWISADSEDPRRPAILLVNGNADTRDIFRTLFNYHGYRIVLAETGTDALETVRTGEPDLIVMEHPVAIVHGSDLLQTIRERGWPGRTKVLIVTALPAVPLTRSWYDAMLAKPVHLDILLETVMRLIGPAPAGPAEGPLANPPR